MQTRGRSAPGRASRRRDPRSPAGRILNLGAGQSTNVEFWLDHAGVHALIDRVDIEDPAVDHPMAGESWDRARGRHAGRP